MPLSLPHPPCRLYYYGSWYYNGSKFNGDINFASGADSKATHMIGGLHHLKVFGFPAAEVEKLVSLSLSLSLPHPPPPLSFYSGNYHGQTSSFP